MASGFVRLVQDHISTETVEALRELLAHAENGRLIGILFAAQFKRNKYIVNAAGEIRKQATLARGMVASLDDFLATNPYEEDPITKP